MLKIAKTAMMIFLPQAIAIAEPAVPSAMENDPQLYSSENKSVDEFHAFHHCHVHRHPDSCEARGCWWNYSSGRCEYY